MTTRRLAAIMFTDIVGYTAMMQKDERAALGCLRKFKQEIESKVAEQRGEVIQFYGDGCLVIFNSAVAAANCARSLQDCFQAEPKVPVRIGIHSGDITLNEGNVYGNAVNITSRIESMGVPGAVLFSKKVKDELKNQQGLEIASLGSFEFKNVEEPMEVFCLANTGFVVPGRSEMKGKLKEDTLRKSIAVLPFANMSGNPEEEYFSDGITEEIIHALAQLNELKVVGRTSAFSFKGQDIDLREIGQKLNVGTVLEGSFRKAGNRIRITAQLIKVHDGFHLWSERFDRELTNIFEVQDEIARTIAEKLKVTLIGMPKESSGTKTQNMEAYQLYLKGRYFQSKRIEGYPKAMECFQQALDLDPQYAAAYYGIGLTYYYMAGYGMIPPKEGFPKAKEAILNAIKYDKNLAGAYLVLAGISMDYDWNWENVFKYKEKALEINSGDVEINKGMCVIQLMLGNIDKSFSFGKKAAELEPVNPDGRIELAYCYMINGAYDESIRVADEMIELDPNYSEAYRVKGMVYSELSESEKAITYFEKASELDGGEGFSPIYLAIEQARSGNLEFARVKLTEMLDMSASRYIPPVFIAWLYGAIDEMDEAYKWLEKAYKEKDNLLVYLRIEPGFITVKDDPRFDDFVSRFNFP